MREIIKSKKTIISNFQADFKSLKLFLEKLLSCVVLKHSEIDGLLFINNTFFKNWVLVELTLKLLDFKIERDPAGRTEQFRSTIELLQKENNVVKIMIKP